MQEGKDVAIIALGDFFQIGEESAKKLAENGINATLINPLSASHIDKETLSKIAENHKVVITLEDGIISGGWGQTISAFFAEKSSVKVLNRGFEKKFLDLFVPADVLFENRLTANQICEDAKLALA